MSPSEVRVSAVGEPIAALSLGVDLGLGQPMEHLLPGARACAGAWRAARFEESEQTLRAGALVR
jgi:hypothetical protein